MPIQTTIERDLTPAGIRRQRRARGMTQTELAARLGITPTAVRHWEAAHRTPAVEVRPRLTAALYGTDPELVAAIADAVLEFARPVRAGGEEGTREELEQIISDAIATYEAGK